MSDAKKNCYACAYSYMEPSETDLVCGKMGGFGKYVAPNREPIPECGPDRMLFEQHPKRNPDGSLK